MNEGRFREAERRMWGSVGIAPTERVLDLARTGARVRVQEAGEGPVVVFVHGASNSGVSWAPLVARLPEYRSVVLDRPGCGLSPPLGTTFADVEALAEFADALVVDVLDAMELASAVLVGTSFGGYATLRGAAAHPDRVSSVVQLGWAVGAPTARLPLIMRLASAPGVGAAMAAIPPNERMVRSMFKQIGLRQAMEANRVPHEVIACYLALLRDTDTMRNEIRTGPRLIRLRGGMDKNVLLPSSLLNSIRIPTFFLWGAEDLFGGADVAREFVGQIPGAELELMPGGHAVWMDDADYVATAVGKFLTR